MQAAMEAEAAMRKAETGVLANVNYGGEQGSGESLLFDAEHPGSAGGYSSFGKGGG
ncbi:MAG: hypothetical protein ACLUDU_00175 [Butyricimonas faecihominis]